MGVRVTTQEHKVALFDSVSGFAFGPVFDLEDEAEAFLTWYQHDYAGPDLRSLSGDEIEQALALWLGGWKRETA